MSRSKLNDVPSPLLSIEQVDDALVDGLGSLGAWGGGLGGAVGGTFVGAGAGVAGARGGTSGGRSGARFGARKLTRLDGEQSTMHIARTAENLQAVREGFFAGRLDERTDDAGDATLLVGIVGSGAGGLNPCVVQLVWYAEELHATAHAKEGLIKQRTCAKALQSLAATVG